MKGGEAEAIEALDHPDPAFFVSVRRDSISRGRRSIEDQQQGRKWTRRPTADRQNQSGSSKSGVEGRFLGYRSLCRNGSAAGHPERALGERQFEFTSARITSGKFEYDAVTLREPEGSPADLDNAIRDWLSDQRLQLGDERNRSAGRRPEGLRGHIHSQGLQRRLFSAVYRAQARAARKEINERGFVHLDPRFGVCLLLARCAESPRESERSTLRMRIDTLQKSDLVPAAARPLAVRYCAISDLTNRSKNARVHSTRQVRRIARLHLGLRLQRPGAGRRKQRDSRRPWPGPCGKAPGAEGRSDDCAGPPERGAAPRFHDRR